MSVCIRRGDYVNDKNEKIRKMLKEDLLVTENENPHKYELTQIPIFKIEKVDSDPNNDKIHIPISYYVTKIFPILKQLNPDSKLFPNDDLPHITYNDMEDYIQLRPEQINIFNSALNLLDTNRCLLLALHTGIGKTKLSIKLGLTKKMPMLCITNLSVLKPQWEAEFNSCTNYVAYIYDKGKQLLTDPPLIHPKSHKPIGLYMISPRLLSDAPLNFFNFIGTFLIDEFDLLCTPTFCPPLLHIHPKYCIGMTATPNNKPNGLSSKIIPLFIGSNWIQKMNNKDFLVNFYYTDLVPIKKKNRQDKLDWNSVLTSIETNNDYNIHICSLVVNEYKDKNILLLLRSIRHMYRLVHLMKELQVSVDFVFGGKKQYDKDARVLIGIQRCLGTGFSDVKFQVCILAFSEKLVEQYKGRIRIEYPLIVDYCHDRSCANNSYEKHANKRREWYESRCGEVIRYNVNLNSTSSDIWKILKNDPKSEIPKEILIGDDDDGDGDGDDNDKDGNGDDGNE